ncbi:hypothetical protein NliqN6_1830 [Naganishia liquefaciens]|uniref:Uncharacterized protein n=1 Tax=Naganishia liquefaciens TaxID=104408 RepID=A0A8H3TR90_9TREE|nr:hypothetical protein NliqN6_1830 [Naganishia liquefaciens]
MSYVPPHLRHSAQPSRDQPTHAYNASSSRPSVPDTQATRSRGSAESRKSYSLSASRHAQPLARPSPSRSSRRNDSAYALESDPNDIKPRQKFQDDGNTARTSSGSEQGFLTDMELIGTVSRSGGLGDENDALKDFGTQERYRAWIQTKLDNFETRFPEYSSAEIDVAAKDALEVVNNILIYLRKLREGVLSSQRKDDFAVEVYETSAAYAIKARNHPQIISSLSVLVPNGYSTALRSQPATIPPKTLHEGMERLELADQPANRANAHSRKGLFTSLLLLYDLVHRQSPRDFVNRFSNLTQASITPQGRRRRSTQTQSFLDASDPNMLYTWNVYQALSQSLPLWLNALRQPIVRLRNAHVTTKQQRSTYHTDALQRIILSWVVDRVRQDAWEILQKGYHPQLGLGVSWCCKLLLFSPVTEIQETAEEWGEDTQHSDMYRWIRAKGGRIQKCKVYLGQLC